MELDKRIATSSNTLIFSNSDELTGTMIIFYITVGDLNSGSHSCSVSALTDPSPDRGTHTLILNMQVNFPGHKRQVLSVDVLVFSPWDLGLCCGKCSAFQIYQQDSRGVSAS